MKSARSFSAVLNEAEIELITYRRTGRGSRRCKGHSEHEKEMGGNVLQPCTMGVKPLSVNIHKSWSVLEVNSDQVFQCKQKTGKPFKYRRKCWSVILACKEVVKSQCQYQKSDSFVTKSKETEVRESLK